MAIEETGVRLIAEGSDRFNRDIREAERYLNAFIGTVESGSRDIDRSTGSAEQSIERFASSSEASFKRVDGFAEIAIGAFRRVGEIAVNAMMEAGRATAQFLSDSVSTAGNFEATLNRFAAVTGSALTSAGMDIGVFNDLFLEMGAKTQFSAQEAAEAAVNLAKGGIEPAAIAAGGLEAALGLAAAGELDLAESSEILAKQLGVWADKGITAIQITDLLAQAANASTVDVDELANGLANVQGRAAGMGVEYQDLVQTMALIAPNFENASTAGTSLNNFLARLIPSTDKAEEAMTDLGLATADGQSLFFDAQGQFIGMEQAIGLLSAATAGLSEEERSAAFNTIFGNDAMGAAIALAESGAPKFVAMGEAMNATGGAAEQAAARNQGYNFALEEMQGSLETLQIVLGSVFLPLLTELIQQHITPGINKLMEFAKAITESEDPIGTLVTKVDELLPGFRSFLDTATNLPTRITEIANAFKEEFAPEIQLAQSIFETAMIVIEDVVTSVVDTITGAFNSFVDEMDNGSVTWTELLKAFEGLWIALEPIIQGVLAALGASLLIFLSVVTGMFTGILNAIDPFLAGWTMVLNFITIVLEGVQEVVMGFVDLVISIFQGNTDGILDALQRMDTGAKTIILGMIGAILSGFAGLVSTGLAFIEGFFLGIVEFFARLYHELVGGSIVVDLVNDILGWFNTLVEDGKQLISDLVTGIQNAFSIDWGAIGSNIISGIANGITGAASALTTAATSAASSAYDAVTGFLGMSSPSKLFMDVGEMTMQGLAIGIDEGAMQPIASLESALAGLAMDLPSMMPAVAPAAMAPNQSVVNNYGDTIYQGDSFGLNVRTPETVGTVGNTIRALQSLSRVR